MKQRALKYERRIPGYALGYIVNGCEDGLERTEKETIDRYMEHWTSQGMVIVSPKSDEDYFTWSPAFGPACYVHDCTIIVQPA